MLKFKFLTPPPPPQKMTRSYACMKTWPSHIIYRNCIKSLFKHVCAAIHWAKTSKFRPLCPILLVFFVLVSVFARMRTSAISYEPLLVGINNVVGTLTGLYIYKKIRSFLSTILICQLVLAVLQQWVFLRECWLGSFVFYVNLIRTNNAREPYIIVIFQGGPDPLSPLWIRAWMVLIQSDLWKVSKTNIQRLSTIIICPFRQLFCSTGCFCENARMNLRCSE